MTPYTPVSWEQLDKEKIKALIFDAIEEDRASLGLSTPLKYTGDLTFNTKAHHTISAYITGRTPGVVCGLPIVPLVLECYTHYLHETTNAPYNCELLVQDGTPITPGVKLAHLSGRADIVLGAERILLNFIQHLSGIATLTQTYVNALNSQSTKTKLLDTRKTLPGYRALQKYAFATGGGTNHRYGLNHWPMFKDNHLSSNVLTAQLGQTIAQFRIHHPHTPVEIEVDTIKQIPFALNVGADIILLDNMNNETMAQAIGIINGKAKTEASGNITLERLPTLGNLGLDFVSTGAPVHKSTWLDIGLDATT